MIKYTEYPLELGDVTPGPGFVKMTMGRNLEGSLEGFHTGGPYLSPSGDEVWKPLDANPCPNATVRYATDEDVCLTEMEGVPGFPKNWRVETQNGRRWLVRPKCWLWPQDKELGLHADQDAILLVENAVRELNARGWEAFGSDLPQLALDPNGDWLVLDLSAAHKPEKWRTDWHGDRDRVLKWMGLVGAERLANLRHRGQNVAHNIALSGLIYRLDQEPFHVEDVFYDLPRDERKAYDRIYASLNRPMSSVWARMDGVRYLDADLVLSPRVHTWVVANRPLTDDEVSRYELTFAYEPWP